MQGYSNVFEHSFEQEHKEKTCNNNIAQINLHLKEID